MVFKKIYRKYFKKQEPIVNLSSGGFIEDLEMPDPLYYATTNLLPQKYSYYTIENPVYPPPAVRYPVPAVTILPPLPVKRIMYADY